MTRRLVVVLGEFFGFHRRGYRAAAGQLGGEELAMEETQQQTRNEVRSASFLEQFEWPVLEIWENSDD